MLLNDTQHLILFHPEKKISPGQRRQHGVGPSLPRLGEEAGAARVI